MTREELLAPIVQSVRRGTTLSRYEILKYFADWDVAPGEVGGQHAWVAAIKGPEVHFALAEGWRPKGSVRGAVRAFFAPLLARHGYLTTRVLHSHPDKKKFVERVGFKPTWRDAQVQYYLLGQLPFERKR